MKYAAIFFSVLVAVALVFGVYTYANARIRVTSVTLQVTPAFEKNSEFEALREAADSSAVMGTPYVQQLDGTAMDYNFLLYTFRLKNGGLIDAEMAEIQPIPVTGDALSYTTLDPSAVNSSLKVPRGGESDAWCVILSSAGAQDPSLVSRTFRVTYYIWGMPRSVDVRYP